MRGEHPLQTSMPMLRAGSSPHARGAPQRPAHERESRGIIPACAGSTTVPLARLSLNWDHPRMRGEHPQTKVMYTFPTGSSPHARGAQVQATKGPPTHGIIPACAGSTRAPRPCTRRIWDHPRMRGEHDVAMETPGRLEGSSPHARGALARVHRDGVRGGIIPACAGSTASRRPSCGSCWDHPRMRGEHS